MNHSFLVQEKKVALVRGVPPPKTPPVVGQPANFFSAFQPVLGASQTKQCVDKVQG